METSSELESKDEPPRARMVNSMNPQVPHWWHRLPEWRKCKMMVDSSVLTERGIDFTHRALRQLKFTVYDTSLGQC